MRITGGEWCGRPILMPRSDAVRPTQDRVREALFNLLQPLLPRARFLDLFAGSGAVGLDALSRGAALADFCERDRTVHQTLLKNLAAFGVAPNHAILRDTLQWLGLDGARRRSAPRPHPYTIAFADPPYRWTQENGVRPLADALAAQGLLADGACFVAELDDQRLPGEDFPGFTLLRDRRYGKSRLLVWRYAAPPPEPPQ